MLTIQNPHDETYASLLRLVLKYGFHKDDRTGVGTTGVHGAQARYDLRNGFPLLTTKAMAWTVLVAELLWFIAGQTNIRPLNRLKCRIWNGNAYSHYVKVLCPARGEPPLPEVDWLKGVMEDDEFSQWAGDLGDVYGAQWRRWPDGKGGTIDQLEGLLKSLRNSPMSRRHIITAWNPAEVDKMALPPCHCLFQFMVRPLTIEERNRLALDRPDRSEITKAAGLLNMKSHEPFDLAGVPKYQIDCELYQRSADLFLGVPFNIASYALFMLMTAKEVNMVPGVFIHSFGDLHIYENHRDQVNEQLSRTSFVPPKVTLNPEIKSIFDYKPSDITLAGYESHPAIKAPMAV